MFLEVYAQDLEKLPSQWFTIFTWKKKIEKVEKLAVSFHGKKVCDTHKQLNASIKSWIIIGKSLRSN